MRKLAIFVVLLIGPTYLFAGTTGKIAGLILDAQSSEPITGANIIIVDTPMGAASDAKGNYFIINVPSGTYTVRAQIIGYKGYVVENVRVSVDLTTTLDFSMESTVIEGEVVVVTAERPLIKADETGTTRIITIEDIAHLPKRGYLEMVSIHGGVVSELREQAVGGRLRGRSEESNNPLLYIRGGRDNEVEYRVDGFSQQDPFSGLSTTSINDNSIQEIVLSSAGFNAEYGRVMSGIVNVITRSGGTKYSGSVEAITDNVGLSDNTYDYNVYDVSLGGLVIPGNDFLVFYVSGEKKWQGDRSPRRLIDELPDKFRESFTDGRLPNNSSSVLTWQAKVTAKLGDATKLRLSTLGSNDDWRQYQHDYFFNQTHMPRYEDKNRSYVGKLTYSINKASFFDLAYSNFNTTRIRADGILFEDLEAYGRPDGNPRFDDQALFWLGDSDTTTADEAHVWDDFLKRNSSYNDLKFDYTNQVNPNNLVKLGFDFKSHTLRRYRHLFPVLSYRYDGDFGAAYDPALDNGGFDDLDNIGYDQLGNETDNPGGELGELDGPKNPTEMSFYIQDKMEQKGVIVNIGLRWDRFNPDTWALIDPDNPLGDDGLIGNDDIVDADIQTKLSPRLGVAFPVSSRTVFYFNYGKYFQPPQLETLYVSRRFLSYKVSSVGYFYPTGNPNLAFESTTAFEVGFKKQVKDNIAINLSGFYKSTEDLVRVRNVPSSPNAFDTYRNEDYGTIKGFDVTFDMRRTENIQLIGNYTLSFAQGTGSHPNSLSNISWATDPTTQPPKLTSPLSFDQRHKLSLNADIRWGAEEENVIIRNTGLNVLLTAGSGFPYTPTFAYNEVTLANVASQPSGQINNAYGPWNRQIDLKVDRNFPLGETSLRIYIWAINILDTENTSNVFTSSGDEKTSRWLTTPDGQAFLEAFGDEGREKYILSESNPLNWGPPRQIRAGVQITF